MVEGVKSSKGSVFARDDSLLKHLPVIIPKPSYKASSKSDDVMESRADASSETNVHMTNCNLSLSAFCDKPGFVMPPACDTIHKIIVFISRT